MLSVQYRPTRRRFRLIAVAVPKGTLGYRTLCPDGMGRHLITTLDALDERLHQTCPSFPIYNEAGDAFASNKPDPSYLAP